MQFGSNGKQQLIRPDGLVSQGQVVHQAPITVSLQLQRILWGEISTQKLSISMPLSQVPP